MNGKKRFEVLGKLPLSVPSGLLKRISECDKTENYVKDFPSHGIKKVTWVIYDYKNMKSDLDSGSMWSSGAGPTVFEFGDDESVENFKKELEQRIRASLSREEDRSNTIWKAYFTEEILKVQGIAVRHFREKTFASRYSREIPGDVKDIHIFSLKNFVIDVRSAEILINEVFGRRDYAGFGFELCREIIKKLKK